MCLIHLFRPILEFSRMEIKYPVAMPVAILKCFLSPLYLAKVVLTAVEWSAKMTFLMQLSTPWTSSLIVASSSLILLILRYHSVSCTRDFTLLSKSCKCSRSAV